VVYWGEVDIYDILYRVQNLSILSLIFMRKI